MTVDDIVAEGDKAAWHRTHRGTHRGEYMGLHPSGRQVKWSSMVISRIVDGKILEQTAISDLGIQLQQTAD